MAEESCLPHGSQEAERGRREETKGKICPMKACPL
jgi:hypothetical protein